MITTENYFSEIVRFGVSNLPEALRKSHEFVVKSTANGSNWQTYKSNSTIGRTIDLYLSKLNQFISLQKESKSKDTEPKKAEAQKVKPADRPRVKKSKVKKGSKPERSKKTEDTVPSDRKKVEHIREEIKFIKRYVSLHNKVKSPNAILNFIKALQRAIVQKLIRKTSPLAKEIQLIQDKLVSTYNSMKGDLLIEINEKDLAKLVVIAGGEEVYPSINIIKRFIGMQGRDLEERKIEAFIKQIENAVKKEKVTKDDPYADKVDQIYNVLKRRKGSRITLSKAELNGLEGIVKACTCKNELGKIYDTNGKPLRKCRKRTYSDAGKGACLPAGQAGSHHKGLSGVLTAEEMANRTLHVLAFFSFWLNLFGKPAKNFTMMFHGEPHNGKTIFLLKFGQFLAENFGKVLYVSSEEFASDTMTSKVKEFLNPFPERLHFSENLKDPRLSDYDFIILDSVNDLGLKISEYKEIRKKHPDTAFVFILQHTKSGDFRGGKDWEHLAEVVGEVEKGVITITKNRYAPKNSLDFFGQFNIQWKEAEQISEPKPNPVNDVALLTRDGSIM